MMVHQITSSIDLLDLAKISGGLNTADHCFHMMSGYYTVSFLFSSMYCYFNGILLYSRNKIISSQR